MLKRPSLQIGGVILLIFLCVWVIGSTAPSHFPSHTVVDVGDGLTLGETADLLAKDGIIRSAFLFKVYAALFGGFDGVKTGSYLFTNPESVVSVAHRIIRGYGGFPVVKVTIPEGSEARDMASIIARSIPDFDSRTFLTLAKAREGFLFPDTYFWQTNLTSMQAVKDMSTIFNNQIKSVQADIDASGRSLHDIVTMASIVEMEASSSADREIIAGILWKRLQAGMPLQADATFFYILSTSTRALTLDNLKLDSPYNSYLYKGLPPTPIGSPSLAAIKAAIHPRTTPYWFYLAGRDGVTHYAATLDGHNTNKAKYLN